MEHSKNNSISINVNQNNSNEESGEFIDQSISAIVQQLSGILPLDITIEDYKKYLLEKYNSK